MSSIFDRRAGLSKRNLRAYVMVLVGGRRPRKGAPEASLSQQLRAGFRLASGP